MRHLSRSLKYTLFLGLCVALALLVALRGDTRDTFQYLDVYRSLSQMPWSPEGFQEQYRMEWGFGLLAGMVKFAGLPPEVLFFIISALTFFAIAKASTAFGLQAWSAMPFYLPTFFLPQQFMQIRQGLAVAFAFWAIGLLIRTQRRWFTAGAISLFGALFHVVSLLPVVVTLLWPQFTRPQRSYKNWIWALVTLTLIIVVCRAISLMDVFALTSRISTYINDEEYGATRSVFELANLRAISMVLAFIAFRPQEDRSWFRAYMLLLGLYVAHLGIRLGFIDFAILSGRLGSSLGFAEIFLLAIIIKDRISRPFWKFIVIGLYMALHLAIALLIQLPFLVDDYFAPL